MKKPRIIISGGGTGGHIFPAIAIANAIRSQRPDTEILFVGALGRMEMQRIPAAGYEIVGLDIVGFDRKRLWRNFGILFKIWKAQRKAKAIVRKFRPDVAVGVGGYASGPTLKVCQQMGIPTVVQEQNSFAGITNRILGKKANRICVAYEAMERFFPKKNIVLTGNPVRQNLIQKDYNRTAFLSSIGLSEQAKTILIVGGSLGAKTLNESVLQQLSLIAETKDVQWIWQMGAYYAKEIKERLGNQCPQNLKPLTFIDDMASVYATADLVISRAGASSISELCLLGKAAILVPSPNVAEDHQTHNALALTNKQAAVLVKDAVAPQSLVATALNLVRDNVQLAQLSQNIVQLARPTADKDIAQEVLNLIERTSTE